MPLVKSEKRGCDTQYPVGRTYIFSFLTSATVLYYSKWRHKKIISITAEADRPETAQLRNTVTNTNLGQIDQIIVSDGENSQVFQILDLRAQVLEIIVTKK